MIITTRVIVPTSSIPTHTQIVDAYFCVVFRQLSPHTFHSLIGRPVVQPVQRIVWSANEKERKREKSNDCALKPVNL